MVKSIQPEPANLSDRARAFLAELEEANGPFDFQSGWQHTTITSSTSETTIVDKSAYRNCPYAILLSNTGASDTNVTISVATAGDTFHVFPVAAGSTGGIALPPTAAVVQPQSGQNWTATCDAATASLHVTVLFVTLL